jgi:hypothetical protein
LKSVDEYETKYRKEPDIRAIGIKGVFDVHQDNVYFAWEGDLRIVKINIKSGAIRTYEGKKQPGKYVKPHAFRGLLDSLLSRDRYRHQIERQKMSYVRNIFITNREHILVIYEGPGEANFRAQFYTLDGKFLDEVPLPGKPSYRMYLNKEKNILYSLANRGVEYFILKYKILE